MKKAIAILLVVLLAATAAFAATNGGNTVTVKSIVGKITIDVANDQAIEDGKTSGLYQIYVEGKDSYTSTKSIASDDVTASFTIIQNAETRTDEGIRLDVTAYPLSLTDDNGTHESNAAALDTFTAVVDSADCNVTNSISGNAVAINLTYQGVDHAVAAGSTICSFNGTWAKTTALAAYPGTYSANIVLAYTIV